MDQKIHLTGLNGIRAIAAIAVVISHTNLGLGEFNLPPDKSLDLAGHGVTMFFALSGFLITYLLLHEKQKQEIDIKKFYLRRLLRIWPLYFLYFAIYVLVASYSGLINAQSSPTLLFYVFFLANVPQILGSGLLYIGHFWSIGVEEQFYLFWPWLIKKAKGNSLFIVTIFTIAYFILRLFFRFVEYKWGNPYPYLAIQVNRFDCMAIGGIGAILFFNHHKVFERIIYSAVTQVIAWIAIILMALNKFHIASVIDPEVISIITVVIIVNVCNNPKRLISLDYPVFDFLGKISYGIYVIHPLVIFLYAQLLKGYDFTEPVKYILVYGGVLFFTITCSYLSYEYFERKFIRLKDKYSVVKSSGEKIRRKELVN